MAGALPRRGTAGAWVEICETLDDVLAALARHGVPLRTETPVMQGLREGLAAAMAAEVVR